MKINGVLLSWLLVYFVDHTHSSSDCQQLRQCMSDLGGHMENAEIDLKYFNKESMTRFYDAVCSDIDGLVKCYHPKNYETCSSLQNFVQFVPSQSELQQRFESMCNQKQELVAAIECFNKEGVTVPLQHCTMAFVSHTILSNTDPHVQQSQICLAVSTFDSCAMGVMKGKCNPETISYIQTSNNQQYQSVCSGSTRIINISFLFHLVMLYTIKYII